MELHCGILRILLLLCQKIQNDKSQNISDVRKRNSFMKLMSTYIVKICKTHGAFYRTVDIYRAATEFFINVVVNEWDYISSIASSLDRVRAVEKLTHKTASNLRSKYEFDKHFISSQAIYDALQSWKQ